MMERLSRWLLCAAAFYCAFFFGCNDTQHRGRGSVKYVNGVMRPCLSADVDPPGAFMSGLIVCHTPEGVDERISWNWKVEKYVLADGS